MERLIDIDVLFDYFGNDAIDKTTRSNIEYFVSEKGTVDAIPKAEIKKFLEEGIKDVNNNVLAIVREDYIHKADYENRLKADMAAMLTDLQLEIEESENCGKAFHLGLKMASNIIQQKINELPPVTPQPRKGYWISRWHAGHDLHFHVCSECNEEFSCDMETGISIDNYRYCPNCGCRMVEPQESEDT